MMVESESEVIATAVRGYRRRIADCTKSQTDSMNLDRSSVERRERNPTKGFLVKVALQRSGY